MIDPRAPDTMSVLMSLGRMARRLGVTQQWLRDQADSGKVPCLKADKQYLFNPAAVQETLSERAANTRQGDSEDVT